jgi:ADP-ribose pyrophosphatase YjhB (NUDIX family)
VHAVLIDGKNKKTEMGNMDLEPKWLEWAKRLQAIAQAGLTYTENEYEKERYKQVRRISIEILSTYTGLEHIQLRSLFAAESGYPTPKIDVRAAVFRDDRILMIREKVDGLWAVPGGWADVDCSLRECVIKEAREEAGANVVPQRVIAILDRKKHNLPPLPYAMYKIFIECDYVDGDFVSNIETSESGFFTQKALPPLSEGRNTKSQIELCFQSRRKSCHQAIFD